MRLGLAQGARLLVRSVRIECPVCEHPLHECASAASSVPWGTVQECPACDHGVRLPMAPFTYRTRYKEGETRVRS